MIFPNRLWPFPFQVLPWEDSDTLHFHARLLRCFLLGLVNVQSELDPALVSRGPEPFRAWHMWSILGQRLADVSLGPDADRHAHEPSSHRVHAATLARCPPKRRYEAPPWLPFATDTTADMGPDIQTDHTVHVAPPFVPHPIHDHDHNHSFTHGLHDQGIPSAVVAGVRPGGHTRVLGRYDGGAGVIGCLIVALLALAIVLSRFWSVAKLRSACRFSTATDSSKWVCQSLSWDPFAICQVAQDLVDDTHEEVGYRTSMPGAWWHERPGQDAHDIFKKSVLTVIPWTYFYSCIQMGVMAKAYFSGQTSAFGVLDHLDRGVNDVIITGREPEDNCSPVANGFDLDDGVLTPAVLNGIRQSGTTTDRDVAAIGRPGDGHSSVSNGFDLDAGVLTPAMLNGTEQASAALDHAASEFGSSIRNLPGSTMPTDNRCLEPSAICDVAVKEPDHPQMTALDVASEDQIGLAFTLVASTPVDRALYQRNGSFDDDEGTSKDMSDEELFGAGTWCTDNGNGDWRRQDALSEVECPLSLRRARSTGCLWRRRDVFDNDGDSDSMEQFNARLSNERESREVPCRSGWSSGSSWQRKGREEETDNWRMRIPRLAQPPEETSDVTPCLDNHSTKLRRYLTPPLNVNAALSDHGASSGDGPQGVYLVPQKRGGRWSPASHIRRSDRPSGLGFFASRKTSTLLTPDARRPSCLYIPDPLVVEPNEADVWLTHGCASATGHTSGGVPEVCSRGAPNGPLSWRDRHQHDPASRRIMFGRRRTMTQG